MTSRDSLRPGQIVLFWLPLAATWFMMALEGPYIAAIVARMPAAAHGLAAIGVATALAWLVESPIMMLLSAATALVRDRESFLALRRFATILNVGVTVAMIVLAIPPVFRLIAEAIIGVPAEIARLAHDATVILILWPAAIGYRRFYQGILVRHHLTRRVAYGTVVRLACMSVTAALLAIEGSASGAVLGAISLLAGVVGEAAASRWMARHVVAELPSDGGAAGSLLTFAAIGRFYLPLALTSVLSMALIPLGTFGLARGAAPVESLAVWPVAGSMIFLFRSGGIAFQEVVIALAGARREHERALRRTAAWLAAGASLSLAIVVLTPPLAELWFQRISGLSERLTAFATLPVRILILFPALEYLLSIQRARWILSRHTAPITIATAIEFAGLGAGLFVTVGALDMIGAVGAAIGMLLGRLAANGFLLIAARQVEPLIVDR